MGSSEYFSNPINSWNRYTAGENKRDGKMDKKYSILAQSDINSPVFSKINFKKYILL